jgi:2-keto-3-deoxy-L-rhamnonate aldolase RhmA
MTQNFSDEIEHPMGQIRKDGETMTARRVGTLAVVCLIAGLMVAWPQAQGRGGEAGSAPAQTGRGSATGPGGSFGTFKPWVPDTARPVGYMVRNTMENPQGKLYNTAKQKMLDGKQVNAWTQSTPDPQQYCAMAPHYDYVWIELQHSAMTFSDAANMIAACPRVGVPIIRVPDADEGSIQKATDVGALGVIVPQVDDAMKAFNGGKFSHYPPLGRRSQGGGQYNSIWGVGGVNYRQTINDNMLTIVMIESPIGVENAFAIASQPGVDVVLVGSSDLASYSGYPASDVRYQDLVLKIHDAALKAGKFFGTTSDAYRTGTPISQDDRLMQNGPSNDGFQPPARGTAPAGGRGGQGAPTAPAAGRGGQGAPTSPTPR